MAVRWLDLVDPTPDELRASLPVPVDADVLEALSARPVPGREALPLLEGRGAYVFGVVTAPWPVPDEDRVLYQEVGLVAAPELLVTVRKTPPGGAPFGASGLAPAAAAGAPVGLLVHRLLDDVADAYLAALDATFSEIEELEDGLEVWPAARVRARVTALRHELLHSRRGASAMRAAVRRILDGRVDVEGDGLFPPEVERLLADTYETLVRVTEELDVARDLVAGAREHYQSLVLESQGEVTKRLTVIASLVLVPSFIVGFYGQNFEGAFDEGFWSLGVSTALIVASTVLQLALFRWRRWI
ncbi:MAG TPA: CorA family divalent cation transporter [Gaiellaceae bacterium]|nr:CorA family divalent cation transporter [Gaiellaceae bacterium]